MFRLFLSFIYAKPEEDDSFMGKITGYTLQAKHFRSWWCGAQCVGHQAWWQIL